MTLERSAIELNDPIGENFMKLSEGNVSDLQKEKASGVVASDFLAIDEKDEKNQAMSEVEP